MAAVHDTTAVTSLQIGAQQYFSAVDLSVMWGKINCVASTVYVQNRERTIEFELARIFPSDAKPSKHAMYRVTRREIE